MKKKEPVVKITDENRDRVVKELGGMIRNIDNTYSATPQSITWVTKNQRVQLRKKHIATPQKGGEIEKLEWHPDPTDLNLHWSFEGYWIQIPLDPNQRGPMKGSYDSRIARVEMFIDEDGTIRKGVCYGTEEGKLEVWYKMEDIIRTFPHWKYDELESTFYNSRKFDWQYKRGASAKLQEDQYYDQAPRGRSRYIPRGSDQYRGRPRGGRRPYYGSYGRGSRWNDPDYEDDYTKWSESQYTEPRYPEERDYEKERRTRREDERNEYERRYEDRDRKRSKSRGRSTSRASHSRVQHESRRRSGSRDRSSSSRRHRKHEEDRKGSRRGSAEASRDYEAKERRKDDDKKRVRSPSPRRGRHRDDSPDQEQEPERRSRRGRRSSTPDPRNRGRDSSNNK